MNPGTGFNHQGRVEDEGYKIYRHTGVRMVAAMFIAYCPPFNTFVFIQEFSE
jgi:hypothetical protein